MLIAYIKEHLQSTSGIQLWNAWLGDQSLPRRKKISLAELKEEHIGAIWGNGFSGRTEYLEVYK